MFFVPESLNASAYSYMAWNTITRKTSPQYFLREKYIEKGHPIYDPDGMADIFGRKIIACTNKFGRIGDEVEITFKYPITPWRNGNTLFAIIGDFKNQNDKNPRCDEWGHIYGHQHCVVEFIVKDEAFNENRRIVDVFPSLKGNPVIKIQRSGVNFIDELSK